MAWADFRRMADRQAGCIVKREARDVQLLGAVNVSALTLNCVGIRPAQAACLPYSS
jgi:hypothetical protein